MKTPEPYTLIQLYAIYDDIRLLHALDGQFDHDADSDAYTAYVHGQRDVLTALIERREVGLKTTNFIKPDIAPDVSKDERMEILRSTPGTRLYALDVYNAQPRSGDREALRLKWATV